MCLADIEDDAAERLALSGLYGLWRLRQASRREPTDSLRRVWHQLPHLLPWSAAGRGSAGCVEVQVVHRVCHVRCDVAGYRRRLCVAEQLLAVRKVCQSGDMPGVLSQLHRWRANTAVCLLWTVRFVTTVCNLECLITTNFFYCVLVWRQWPPIVVWPPLA